MLTVKVIKEMDIVQRVLILHGKVNADFTQNHIILLQGHRDKMYTVPLLQSLLYLDQNSATSPTPKVYRHALDTLGMHCLLLELKHRKVMLTCANRLEAPRYDQLSSTGSQLALV